LNAEVRAFIGPLFIYNSREKVFSIAGHMAKNFFQHKKAVFSKARAPNRRLKPVHAAFFSYLSAYSIEIRI